MAIADYDVNPSAILKDVYLPPIHDVLNNETILMKRLNRNTKDFEGNRGVLSLRTGRNVGVGARGRGLKLPARGTQEHTNSYIDTKYNYARFYVDGVNMKKTKGSRGAFARLVDTEINGLTKDMQQEINRQLFGDGSGALAISTGTSETGSTGNAMIPYLWSPAGKYVRNRDDFQVHLLTLADMTTLDPASADAAATAMRLVGATTTNVKYFWSTAATGGDPTNATAGDLLGTYRGLQDGDVQYEMMGLFGICSDSNLIGDYNWDYPGEYSAGNQGAGATGAWINPEGSTYTYALTGISQTLQGVDANAKSWWRGYVDGNNGVPRAITQEILDDFDGVMRVERDANTSLCITTFRVRNKIADLWQQNRRFVNTMTLDGGFSAIEYNGMPIVAEKDCPRGVMFALDESLLELFVLNDFDWVSDNAGQVLHWITDYHAFEASLWYGAQLATSDRGRQGMIVDIAEE